MQRPLTVESVVAGLRANDYLADEGLATAIFLALRLHRPLLLEGEAGVGKTEVAKVLSAWTGGELIQPKNLGWPFPIGCASTWSRI